MVVGRHQSLGSRLVIAQLKRVLILHAANIHCGGGFALLKELLRTHNFPVSWAQFDKRTKGILELPIELTQYYVTRNIISRLWAEFRLWRECKSSDVVLCFHGIPPLLPLSGRAVVFVQNRILVEQGSLADYPLQTRLRLLIERFWLLVMKEHASRYIVQTPSMAASLRTLLGAETEICVLPFASLSDLSPTESVTNSGRKFDFLYVASGDAHKNHVTLLEAWRLLAEEGLKPSLALTVDPLTYPSVAEEILRVTHDFSLNIVNLGQLSPEDILGLYQSASALIYPSKTESFGLPLIEAMHCGLPILASELDYVRDVVVPVETFDPGSPVSIARAVRRFLGKAEPTIQIHSAEEFLAEVLK